jgi:hypothetical protein
VKKDATVEPALLLMFVGMAREMGYTSLTRFLRHIVLTWRYTAKQQCKGAK